MRVFLFKRYLSQIQSTELATANTVTTSVKMYEYFVVRYHYAKYSKHLHAKLGLRIFLVEVEWLFNYFEVIICVSKVIRIVFSFIIEIIPSYSQLSTKAKDLLACNK